MSEAPIFIRTLFFEGKLDPDLVASVAISLTQNELQKFMLNMTQEVNLYTALTSSQCIQEFEEQLVTFMPIQRATIWVKSEDSDFILSPTLKESLILGKTVLTPAFSKSEDISMGDPASFPGFSHDFDLPILRGFQSMLLLPIVDPESHIIAVLQCCGYQNNLNEMQSEFPQYHIDTLKIVRNLCQRKFFSNISKRTIPSNISKIFSQIETSSVSKTSQQISDILQTIFLCEIVEIFEFEDRSKTLIRLIDDIRFKEEDGGISFQAGIIDIPINLSNKQIHPNFKEEIDGKHINQTILSQSLGRGRNHFVITLRGKRNMPGFTPEDIDLIKELSSIICDALRVAKFQEMKERDRMEELHELKMLRLYYDTMNSISSQGMEHWDAVKNAAKEIFNCETLFISMFDGRYMKFYPNEIKCRFEECAAGNAFNSRDTIFTELTEERSKLNLRFYKQFGIKFESSLAFPYRVKGRVIGAIEIINPKKKDIPKDDQLRFGILCSCLMANPEK
jgi:hypothetical protein